jgi:hypothetical protein
VSAVLSDYFNFPFFENPSHTLTNHFNTSSFHLQITPADSQKHFTHTGHTICCVLICLEHSLAEAAETVAPRSSTRRHRHRAGL